MEACLYFGAAYFSRNTGQCTEHVSLFSPDTAMCCSAFQEHVLQDRNGVRKDLLDTMSVHHARQGHMVMGKVHALCVSRANISQAQGNKAASHVL
jgi:hypothetical protein